MIEKFMLGGGFKRKSKAINIPGSSDKSTVKKIKKYGACVNLPRADCPYKMSPPRHLNHSEDHTFRV